MQGRDRISSETHFGYSRVPSSVAQTTSLPCNTPRAKKKCKNIERDPIQTCQDVGTRLCTHRRAHVRLIEWQIEDDVSE